MRKILKIFLIMITTSILFLTSIENVKAMPKTILTGPAKEVGEYIGGVKVSSMSTTDGYYLYCINMKRNLTQNIQANYIPNSKLVNGGVYYLLRNGYPYKSITGDAKKDYYITQTAFWWYLDETTGSQNLGEQFKSDGSDTYGLRSKVKNLLQGALAHKNDQVPTLVESAITLNTNNTSLTQKGDYYVSESISATTKNVNTYSVTLSSAPDGTIIERNDGQKSTNNKMDIGINQSFIIKVPTSKISNETSIKVEAKATGATQYDLGTYQPLDYEMQTVALMIPVTHTATSNLNLTISSTVVSITKIDSTTKKPLAGAELAIENSKGEELTRWTSTLNAHIIKNLENGTYKLKEISAPSGYEKNNSAITFTVSDSNRDIKLNFENTPKKVVINITKVDQATNQPLAGATLQIKNSKGEVVYKFISSNQAEVITDLDYGTYTVEEIAAPSGYIKSDKVVTFTVDEQHLSHQILLSNAKEVPVPDTASASSIMLILGLVIVGIGIAFIRKNAKNN